MLLVAKMSGATAIGSSAKVQKMPREKASVSLPVDWARRLVKRAKRFGSQSSVEWPRR